MPIYDLSYRPYSGGFSSHQWRWWTITKAGLAEVLSKKLFLIFLFVGTVPAIARGVMIWFTHQSADAFTSIDAGFFRSYLSWQSPFLMLIGIWPGALLIAGDLKTNAIQLYLARPLTRPSYVMGKLGIIVGIGALLLTAPALLLFLMEVGLSADTTFLTRFYWIPFALLGYSAMVLVGLSIFALAVSSITRSGRYAGLLFFALIFFSQPAAFMFGLMTSSSSCMVLSMAGLVDQIGMIFFGGPSEFGDLRVPALFVYAAVIGLSVWILKRRVKAVDIVT